MEASKKKSLLKCNYCDVLSTCRASLDIHLRTHFGIKPHCCSLCGKAFSRRANCQRHEESHTSRKKYECGVCKARYTCKGTLMKHMQFHTGENLLSCDLCSRQFTQRSHLKAHKRTHTGEKPHKCLSCDKKFAIEYDLKIHQTVHEGKEMTCGICGKIFHHLGSYRGHMIRHRQTKIYKCPVCGIDFHAQCSLRVHMRIHTGEKPFRCEICNKTFTRNAGLREHSTIHTKDKSAHELGNELWSMSGQNENSSTQPHELGAHICSICLKRYANKYSLNQHMKVHAEKPIRCSDCDRVFSSDSSLKKHRENRACHVKKFSCPFCKNVFIKKVNIIIHVKKTHVVELEGVEESSNEAEKYPKCSICTKRFKTEQSCMWHEACYHRLVDQVESDIVMEQKVHAAAAVQVDSRLQSESLEGSENIYCLKKVGNDEINHYQRNGSEMDSDSSEVFPENRVFIKEELTDDGTSSNLLIDDKTDPPELRGKESTDPYLFDYPIKEENLVFIKEEIKDDSLDIKEEHNGLE